MRDGCLDAIICAYRSSTNAARGQLRSSANVMPPVVLLVTGAALGFVLSQLVILIRR